MLSRKGVTHEVLNAKFHDREAEIVAQAGRSAAVTISTNMAGRGTDIVLGGNPEMLARQLLEREGFELGHITVFRLNLFTNIFSICGWQHTTKFCQIKNW